MVLGVQARSEKKQSLMMPVQRIHRPKHRHHLALSSQLSMLLDANIAIQSAARGFQKLGKLAIWSARCAWLSKRARDTGWLMIWRAFVTRTSARWRASWWLVGAAVRAAGTSFTGQRLLEAADLPKLKEHKIMVEGMECCIGPCCHGDCPFKDDPGQCRYHHLDPKLHPPHGLLEQCKTAQAVAKLAKEMRMFGVSLGGFKCETAVPVEARSALIKEIRGSASGPVGSAHLPPAAIYAMVAEGEHPNEVPLKTLMNGTGVSVADLRIPAPERAFDFEPVSADDRASLAQSTLDAGTGDVWRKHVLDRISEQHAERDIFVAWAARRMSLRISENPEQTVDDAFAAVMTDGASRGSRVLGPLSARTRRSRKPRMSLLVHGFAPPMDSFFSLSSSSKHPCRPRRPNAQFSSSLVARATQWSSLVASLKPWMLATWFSTSMAPSTSTSACYALIRSSTSSLRASSRAFPSGKTAARNGRQAFDSKPQQRWSSLGRRRAPCPSPWRSCAPTSVAC